jgi:regulatory protein
MLLSSREHSRRELKRKLLARGHPDAQVESLLDDLCDRALLSDERMAEIYVNERVRKGFGPVRIRQELRQRGLDDDLIEPHLDRSTEDWLDRMAAAHDKKFGPGRAVDAKERARRARFLAYRGFSADLIAAFLHRGTGF